MALRLLPNLINFPLSLGTYWLPNQRNFVGFGHPYPLLVTEPAEFCRFRAPIFFIGYRTEVFLLVSGTHTLYWLPNQRNFVGFGHPYPLLVTEPAEFCRFRAPIFFIGYRTEVFLLVSGTHTLYWLPNQRNFVGFGHPYPLLVTEPAEFCRFRAPISFIGYRTGGILSVSGTHILYWLPNQRNFVGFGHPYSLLVTPLADYSWLWAPIQSNKIFIAS